MLFDAASYEYVDGGAGVPLMSTLMLPPPVRSGVLVRKNWVRKPNAVRPRPWSAADQLVLQISSRTPPVRLTSEGGVGATANDLVIEQKIGAKLLAADGVRSVNFRYRAVNGIVYLFGRAHSQAELDKAMAEARISRGT